MEQNNAPTSSPTFEHAQQKFLLKLTLGEIDRILNETGIDLAPDDAEYDPFFALNSTNGSPRKLAAFLWSVFKPQCEARGVDQSAFMDMDGDALADGWQCVFAAIDFFIRRQCPARAEALRQYLEHLTELELKMASETKVRLGELMSQEPSDSDAESVPPSSDSSLEDTATES